MHHSLVTNETDGYLTLDNNAKVSRLLALSLEQLANEDESDCFEKKASTRYDYDNDRKNTEPYPSQSSQHFERKKSKYALE